MKRLFISALAIIGLAAINSNCAFAQEAVDLGLHVKWASFNLGATSPEESGDYYAWGETEIKAGEYNFTESNYKFCQPGGKYSWQWIITKYNKEDSKKILEPSDDAARIKWGKNWRIPTPEDFYELDDYCKWEWTAINGVNGFKVISEKPGYEGNWIFFPAAGKYYEDSLDGKNTIGIYWTSSLGVDEEMILVFRIKESGRSVYDEVDRFHYGLPIRPVMD